MIIAIRYAKSLLDLSLEKGKLEEVYKDMTLVANVCQENHDFITFLRSPIIKADKKMEVIDAVFKKNVSELSRNFLDIITRKGREKFIGDIALSFIEQYKENKKILTAVITSANGIDEQTRTKVLELVKGSSKSEVELIEKTDKNLIGGFIIRVGDRQVDASIRRKLDQLKKNFSDNPFVKEF